MVDLAPLAHHLLLLPLHQQLVDEQSVGPGVAIVVEIRLRRKEEQLIYKNDTEIQRGRYVRTETLV